MKTDLENGSWMFGVIAGWYQDHLAKDPKIFLTGDDLAQAIFGEINLPGEQENSCSGQ